MTEIEIRLENRRALLTAHDFSRMMNAEMSHIQSPAFLDMGERKRVYFCSRLVSEKWGQDSTSRIYFVDFDAHFDRVLGFSGKPVSDLGAIGSFDEHGTNPISVVRVGDKLHIYYVGWSRSVAVPYSANIGVMISKTNDNNEFERVFSGPVISFDQNEPFLIGSPRVKKFKGMLYMWYVAGKSWNVIDDRAEPTYKIRMAKSQDGITWEKDNRDLIEDILDALECQAAPEVIELPRGFLMIYSFRSAARSGDYADYRVNTAYSTDLTNWRVSRPVSADRQYPGLEATSYHNLSPARGGYQSLFQLEDMGKAGIGIGKLVVEATR